MNHRPMNQPQSPEDILEQLILVCDCLPQMYPGQGINLKVTLTELMPDIKDRNWQRASNIIDIQRDSIIRQIEQQHETSLEVKEHQKEGVRWQAKVLKWMLDGMKLEQQRCILLGKA